MNHQWHKVSPVAIIYFLITSIFTHLKNIVINMMPIAVAWLISIENKIYWLSRVGSLVFIIIIIGSVLFYFNFRYRIKDSEVVVKKGVFVKQAISINFEKIQNVNISTPWYFKPFNLINCTLDSAGSAASEISIPGIKLELAQMIMEKVQQQNQSSTHSRADSGTESTETTNHAEPTFTISPKEVIKYGFTNGMIFLFILAMFPIIQKVIRTSHIDFSSYFLYLSSQLPIPEFQSKIIISLLLFLLSVLILLSISSIAAVIRFHRFEFYNDDQQFRKIMGLFERSQVSIKKHKIQGLTIKQNLLSLFFGRGNLEVHQTQQSKNSQARTKSARFIVPFIRPSQWQHIAQMAFPKFKPQELKFQPIERHFLKKNFLLYVLIPLTAITVFLTLNVHINFISLLLLLPLGFGLVYLRYMRYGIWNDRDFIIIRSGLFGQKWTIFPIFKLQQVSFIQTPLQRKKQVLKLQLQLAFYHFKLPYINQDYSLKLFNYSLYRVEKTDTPWI